MFICFFSLNVTKVYLLTELYMITSRRPNKNSAGNLVVNLSKFSQFKNLIPTNPLWYILAMMSILIYISITPASFVTNRIIKINYSNKAFNKSLEAKSLGKNIVNCPYGSTLLGCELCRIRSPSVISSPIIKIISESNNNNKSNTAEAFTKIYDEKIWGDEGLGSGVGSTKENAEGAVYALRMILYKYGIFKLLDAPCGALAWTVDFIKQIKIEIPCFTYTGVDIVSSVIESNKKIFLGDNNVNFYCQDLSDANQLLPVGHDMILSRDALQHLSMDLIKSTLINYCRSNTTYLLVGSYISAKKNKNKNIRVGLAFSINLLLPPFNFPNPLEAFDERTRDGKHLLFYRLHPDLCESESFVRFVNG